MPERHEVIDGKVYVYRRENSRFWQCAAYIGGYNHRQSTGLDDLEQACAFAREWYDERAAEERLRERGVIPPRPGRRVATSAPRRRRPGEKTLRDAATMFLREYRALVAGERNPAYVASKESTLRVHVLPILGELPLSAVDGAAVQEYRIRRLSPPTRKAAALPRDADGWIIGHRPRPWRRPARSTLHKEIVCLRQVLKTALRRGWIAALPDLSEPYRASAKVSHRAWFSHDEYRRLYEATRARARRPPRERWRGPCEDLHDYVLIMANTGLRPDEAARLEHRDVEVLEDADSGERILQVAVRGKRGVGFCKSMPGAVGPYERLRNRHAASPTDTVFGATPRQLLNKVLRELDLKTDREGRARTAYSLRHTYICFRLMEGADIYQVAKNCRTSVEMIETYYAAHISSTLDAAAINVRKPRRPEG